MFDFYFFEFTALLIAITIYVIGEKLLNGFLFKQRLADLRPPTSGVKKKSSKLFRVSDRIRKWLSLLGWGRIKNFIQISPEEIRRLKRAGVYSLNIYAYYKLIKVASALGVAFLYILVILIFFPRLDTLYIIMLLAAMSVFGYKSADIIFKRKGDRRLLEANRFFSDYLQLFVISLSAGLSLEAALRRVSVQIKTQSVVLHQESEILLAELSLRGDRSIAFSQFGERLQSEYFRNLAVIMQQTERQGVSSVAALKTLASTQSQDRFSQIEAKVGRLGVLMTIPLILFVFPLLFGIIIVPSVLL